MVADTKLIADLFIRSDASTAAGAVLQRDPVAGSMRDFPAGARSPAGA